MLYNSVKCKINNLKVKNNVVKRMWKMIDDNEYQLNIYKIDTKVKIDKKRVIL